MTKPDSGLSPGDLTYETTSRWLSTQLGDLHYHEAGEGSPVVLLHGSGPGVSGWANFRGNVPAFASRHRTLVLDLPGFGQSYATEAAPIQAAMGALLDFIDGLGLEQVPLVGNSLGGAVAAGLAAAHPERVERLVTIGGVGAPLFGPMPPEGIKRLVEFVENPSRELLVAWMESMVFDRAALTDEFVQLRWESASDPGSLASMRRMYSPEMLTGMRDRMLDPARVGLLTKITVPTLLLFGRDDRVTPLDSMLVPMRYIAQAELHVFHDCGHWPMIERQAEFESVVLSYLARTLGPNQWYRPDGAEASSI